MKEVEKLVALLEYNKGKDRCQNLLDTITIRILTHQKCSLIILNLKEKKNMQIIAFRGKIVL